MSNPKPKELKILSNTVRPCRDKVAAITLPVVTGVPEPPKWLPNIAAVVEFNRLATILVANKLLTEGSISSLGHLAALHGKLVDLWAAGLTPSGFMISQYRSLISEFGLSPLSSTKIGGAAPAKKPNAFSSNGKKA